MTLTMNPALDVNSSVEYVFSDVKLRCRTPRQEPGGGGINVARAVARLGGEALAIYAAGGPSGDVLEQLLEQEGVPQRRIPIAEWTRRNVNVREDATGRQYRFVFPGPTLAQCEWRSCLGALEAVQPGPEFLVASGSLPPGVPGDFYARVAAIARTLRARFVLDTSGEPLRLAVEEGVFLVKPSLREFRQLIGGNACTESALADAARHLIAKGHCEAVVLSLGEGGALWVTAAQEERLGAPAVPVESSVGAGDAMVAGIVLSLARGRPIAEAVRFGVAAGAAAVMNPGYTALPPGRHGAPLATDDTGAGLIRPILFRRRRSAPDGDASRRPRPAAGTGTVADIPSQQGTRQRRSARSRAAGSSAPDAP